MKKSKSAVPIQKFIINKLKQKNKRYLTFKVNTNLFEQGIDSLDFFSLIFDLEKEYKIKINEKMYSKLNTIKKIIESVKSKK
tara:strand:+ start:553 stop:798 length:246 start_codon:yes stop_codon:yes gene_type:complete